MIRSFCKTCKLKQPGQNLGKCYYCGKLSVTPGEDDKSVLVEDTIPDTLRFSDSTTPKFCYDNCRDEEEIAPCTDSNFLIALPDIESLSGHFFISSSLFSQPY